MKRISALVLALVLCLALGTAALASGEAGYPIRLDAPVSGQTYNAYKIFDVTDDSFTMSADSPWLSMVMDGYMVYDEIDSMGFSSLPFTVTEQGDAYAITIEDGTSWDDIVNYFPNAQIPEDAEVAVSGTCEGGSLSLTVSEAGLYYVTDADGAPVCLAAVMPSALASGIMSSLTSTVTETWASGEMASGEMGGIMMNGYSVGMDGDTMYISLTTALQPSGADMQVLLEVITDDSGSMDIYDMDIFSDTYPILM